MEPEVFRVSEFCVRYAISRRSFYRELKANRLRIFKRGRRTLIAREDAELWFQNIRQLQPQTSAQ
jgi:hypothetical protein